MNKLLILVVLTFTINAHASIITVEPDNFANGADISNATDGVSLQRESGNSVYATVDPNYGSAATSTGTQVFGYDAGFGVEPFWDNQNIFRATFSTLVDYVAIDVINNNGPDQGTDKAFMEVWGNSGLLAMISSSAIDWSQRYQTLSFQSTSANIQYIRMSSSDGSDFNLDNLRFNTVPEPGSLALITIGLLGYFSRRERS